MTRRHPTTETRIVLRTILGAGVLAVLLLAGAGAAAGATWVVDDDDDGADFASIRTAEAAAGVSAGTTWDVYPGAGTPIQDVVDGAGGMRFMCMRGRTPGNVDVWKRVTLEGEGADVVTSCERGKVIEN